MKPAEIENPSSAIPAVRVRDLTMAYGSFVIMRDLNFDIPREKVFVIMGGSGCGKSTLLRHLIGLNKPAKGRIQYGNEEFSHASDFQKDRVLKKLGVLFQGGALWSGMTLAENVMLPIREFTRLPQQVQRQIASLKLALVGLKGFEDFYPSEISGGMRKRAGLARAMALDPEILLVDEPSAGLDPLSSKRLDHLILELRDSLGTTVIVVTHELASIFAIGDDALFLDAETKSAIDRGNPKDLARYSKHAKVREFLSRGEGDQNGR